MIYMIRAGEIGPIKIGVAVNVESRRAELQVGNAEVLTVIRRFEGGETEELALHLRFQTSHLRCEWFAFHADMLGDLGLVEVEPAPREEPPETEAPRPGIGRPARKPDDWVIVSEKGKRLRELRRSMGKTQTDMAILAGVHQTAWSLWERGKRWPNQFAAPRVAERLGIAPDFFKMVLP